MLQRRTRNCPLCSTAEPPAVRTHALMVVEPADGTSAEISLEEAASWQASRSAPRPASTTGHQSRPTNLTRRQYDPSGSLGRPWGLSTTLWCPDIRAEKRHNCVHEHSVSP